MQAGARFGKYELVERIGKGGMGEVWRAKHQMLKRQAAVKLIRPDALGPEVGGAAAASILKRFEREAQATSGLRSPHTIELYDFGLSDDGTFYYAMELLEGLSLHSLVQAHGPVSAARAVYILAQTCESLAEAHHAGLVHRDIKPANVYLCRLGLQYDFVKVLDFGLVKREPTSDVDQTALTSQGIAPGSPAFMAPELARGGEAIDPRVDIYALGCVAYWLLSGNLVFERPSAIEMVVAHVKEEPDPLSTRTETEIPKALEKVIMACLAKKPDDRPSSAKQLRQKLIAAVSGAWDTDQAEHWWLTHKPALTIEKLDSSLKQDVVELAKAKASGAGEKAASAVAATAAAAGAGTAAPAPADVATDSATDDATEPPGAPLAPTRPPIDTAMAMAPPESTDPMDLRRNEIRSVLQHNFTQSRIDLNELEARLGMMRAAKNETELDKAIEDLEAPAPLIEPTPIPIVESAPARHANLPVRARRSRKIVSVFSGVTRKGRWTPGADIKLVSVFGGAELDFRYVVWEQAVTEVKCTCVFGGASITVPPDIYVEVDGVGVFGAFEHSGSSIGTPGEGVPVLRITGAAVFGGVEVKVRNRKRPGERTGIELVGEAIKKLVSGDH